MIYRRSFFLFVFFICVNLSNGQIYDATQNNVNDLVISSTISNQQVTSFAEDTFGHIWISTIRGLNKHNVYEYHQYFKTDDSLSVSDNRIQQVYKDSKDRLWVATVNGVCRYNELDCFDQVPVESPSTNVLNFFEDNDGKLYINLNFQVCSYNEAKDIFQPVINELDYKNSYTSCFVDKNNNIWNVTPREVRCTNGKTYERTLSFDPGSFTTFSYLTEDGDLWLASWDQLRIYDTRKNKYTKVPLEISNHALLSKAIIIRIHRYNPSSLLIQTQKDGLFIYNRFTGQIIHEKESGFPFEVPDFEITTFFTDSRNNLWIGSFDQGFEVRYSYKERFNSNNFLRSKTHGQSISAVTTDQNNHLFMVIRSKGIKVYREDNHQIDFFSNKELYNFWPTFQHKARKVYVDNENNIWILSDWMLLKTKYEGGKINLEKYFYFPEGILSITQDSRGTIWLGGSNEKIYTLEKGDPEFNLFHLYGKEFNFTPVLLTLSTGKILVASFAHDLQIIDPNTWEVNSIPILDKIKRSNFIPTSLFEDSNGDIWIGTITNGIFKYKTEDKEIEVIEGAACTDISSITEDYAGNIWIGTLYGLSKYNRTDDTFINFYKSDGIGGNQFNEQCVCKLPNQTLVFGGTHGLTLFNPIDVTYKQKIPLLLENLKIDNELVHPLESNTLDKHMNYNPPIKLKHNQNSFSISFAAIDYGEYERVKYAYMLEGFDNMWIEANNGHTAFYSNIPTGKYTFKVKIYNNENTISETINKTSVKIKAAPWFSWPAIIFYIIIFELLLVFIIRTHRRIKANKEQTLRAEREREQEQRVNKMNMSFFSNLSHEFRTPLTIISGPVETLYNSNNIKGENKQLLAIIQRSVNRMLKLVNQLMDFNKLENDTLRLKVQLTDVIEEIKKTLEIFKINAIEKKIELNTFGIEDNYIMLLDTDKLEKILNNLLSNALKFNKPNGKIEVYFDVISREDALKNFNLSEQDSESQFVKIAIKDSGHGIPEDKLEKIFERYYQLDNQSKESYNWGAGIGLYYVRCLVNLHHGYIKAENNPEGGSKFTFILPVSDTAYSKEEKKVKDTTHYYNMPLEEKISIEQPLSEKNLELKQKIMIVDDDTDIIHYLKTLLCSKYQVFSKFDAESAYKSLKETAPDLILCDVVMPGTNGYELSRKIKENISFSHIPIILVTAKATVENQVEGLNTGADAYVTKPFNPSYLLALIKSQLKNREKIKNLLGSTTKTETIDKNILTPQDNSFIKNLYDLMEKELSNPELNISRMTEVLKISRTKFYYKVKGLTGQNPNVFFKTYKLNRAAELILEGKYNISEIADMTGFTTLSHFSVSFKKQFNVSPSNYSIRK